MFNLTSIVRRTLVTGPRGYEPHGRMVNVCDASDFRRTFLGVCDNAWRHSARRHVRARWRAAESLKNSPTSPEIKTRHVRAIRVPTPAPRRTNRRCGNEEVEN